MDWRDIMDMKSNLDILIYHEEYKNFYKNILLENGFKSIKTASSPKEAKEKLPNTKIIFAWKFPTHLLSLPEASSVQWFQSMGAGVDDILSDKSVPNDILLTRVIDQFGGKISEYVFAYILFISKSINQLQKFQQEKKWSPILTDFLADKVIGVAGLGSIGSEIVRKAKAFDMTVYGLSNSGKNSSIVDRHFFSANWISFVKNIDILVLTLPLTKKTKYVISKEVLQNMKKDAWLINVGRGKLISESSLISHLYTGKLGAVILDVFEKEPLPFNSELWEMPNVYITPHISGPSIPEEVGNFFLSNLNLFMSNKNLKGTVNRSMGF